MTAEADPVLPEMIRRALESRLGDLQVSCPGIVVDYDAATQTATVQPATRRTIPNGDGDLIAEDLPPIPNVPVSMFRTATLSITSTLVKGDTVQLVFNTRAPTEWRTSGEIGTPADARLHGFGYPVAYPGYLSNVATKPDTDDSIGTPGGLRMHFTPSSIEAGTGSAPVALATLVATELAKISAVLLTNAGAPLTYTPAAVASTNLKAD